MALTQITPPTAEPVDLAEAKLHARVDIPDDDTMIGALLGAARDYAENLTGKQLVSARWKQTLDSFPGGMIPSAPYSQTFSLPGNAILLRRHPVIQVVSIQYLDMGGVVQTVDPTTYVADLSTEPARITPVFGQIWPIPMPQIGSVWVTFDAGYAAPIISTGNSITVQGWAPLVVGDAIRLSNSGGALPSPLKAKTDYFVQSVVSPGVYALAATSGGSAITLTGPGTGTSYLGVVPEGISAWLKIRLSTIYENREEVAIMTRGKIDVLPYVDRLLDGFRVIEF
ncbi:MAG TPA: head-tail connector protein [Burkholderiales bacterium]|nr:head-tail connector protein [Burkholderiales bacterium]